MSTMAEPRIEVGKNDEGYSVFLFHFQSLTDDGQGTIDSYQVRMGNHTIATKATREEAETVAKALVGNLNTREVAPEPTPAMAEHATAVRERVSKR